MDKLALFRVHLYSRTLSILLYLHDLMADMVHDTVHWLTGEGGRNLPQLEYPVGSFGGLWCFSALSKRARPPILLESFQSQPPLTGHLPFSGNLPHTHKHTHIHILCTYTHTSIEDIVPCSKQPCLRVCQGSFPWTTLIPSRLIRRRLGI